MIAFQGLGALGPEREPRMPRLFWRRLSPFHSLLGFLTFLLRTLKLSPSHWNILPLELVVP